MPYCILGSFDNIFWVNLMLSLVWGYLKIITNNRFIFELRQIYILVLGLSFKSGTFKTKDERLVAGFYFNLIYTSS